MIDTREVWTMRVLVVEDSTVVQSFHKFALGMFKEMELDMAMDGVAAIKLLAEHRYDVVLLDINLPLMDGMKVLSTMKRKGGHHAETPVIMVTSEADAETARRALELGAFKILHKPVAAHDIRDAVTEALNQPAAEPPELREKRSATATVVHRRDEPSRGMPAGFGVSFDHDSPEPTKQMEQAFLLPEHRGRGQ
jgi:two-component system chemotaxis response regulator CheY